MLLPNLARHLLYPTYGDNEITTTMAETEKKVLILGIGNILWADEGFGVRAVEALNRRYTFGDNVLLMDGGTQGIYLLQHVQATDYLVVFDAVDYGDAPGTLRLVEDDAVPNFMGAKKMSLHQTGFQEVLSMARLLGGYPERLLLVGVQPEELEDYGGSLRPVVRACLEPAMEAAIDWLRKLGITTTLREMPLPESAMLTPPQIELDAYERGRPNEQAAPRIGDARFLLRDDVCFDPKPIEFEGPRLSVCVDHRRQD